MSNLQILNESLSMLNDLVQVRIPSNSQSVTLEDKKKVTSNKEKKKKNKWMQKKVGSNMCGDWSWYYGPVHGAFN